MRIAMVSEHASPLAALGGADAGGQNVHVASLALALAERGHEIVVHTRRDDPRQPEFVPMAPGIQVHHVPAGPPHAIPKDELLPYLPAFTQQLERQWRLNPPDVVHAHFWMSGVVSVLAATPLGLPVAITFHALGTRQAAPSGRCRHEPTRPPGRGAQRGSERGRDPGHRDRGDPRAHRDGSGCDSHPSRPLRCGHRPLQPQRSPAPGAIAAAPPGLGGPARAPQGRRRCDPDAAVAAGRRAAHRGRAAAPGPGRRPGDPAPACGRHGRPEPRIV